jgi:hypothetical protein
MCIGKRIVIYGKIRVETKRVGSNITLDDQVHFLL